MIGLCPKEQTILRMEYKGDRREEEMVARVVGKNTWPVHLHLNFRFSCSASILAC